MTDKRHVKVLKLEILKPVGDVSWNDLAQTLRDVRYRVFRLANLAVSEKYLEFHLYRTGRTEEMETRKLSALNKDLRVMLQKEQKEGVPQQALDRFSKTGALPATITDALGHYTIRGLTSKSKWREVLTGKASLPTFRLNVEIPIICHKKQNRRLERTEAGDVELDLMVCMRPYLRVVLKTGKLNGSPREILKRLLDNPGQKPDGYRQRCFGVKYNERTKRWWLAVTYDFPAEQQQGLSKERIVGVDLGYACPMYVALSNGHARLGWQHFAGLAGRVRTLQRQVMARRRNMLRGGRSSLSNGTARSGHGRKRKLQSIEQLQGRIDNAYTTLNHQLSSSLIDFARNHGAGVVQMEDLTGLSKVLTGTFLGERWRYHQLQTFIEYKAKEAGIEVRRLNPQYTSRRCSNCGYIHNEFTREFRDSGRREGSLKRFECPKCDSKPIDPDYNAARNLATLDIENIICQQCAKQGINLDRSSAAL